MLTTLHLVEGAVAERDLIPVLTHFHLYDGRIQGGNGKVTIDAPLPVNLNATVPAASFIKAIATCKKDPKINVTKVNLIITEGMFRAQLPLADHQSFPFVEEPKQWVQFKHDLLPVLRRLRPFVGNDASRPWLCSIAFRGGYAYATTNPVAARVSWQGPDMVIPVYAIDELLRMNRKPLRVSTTDTALGFDLGEDVWFRTSLLDAEWPDIEKVFSGGKGLKPVPPDLKEAVERVLPFCPDGRVPEIRLNEEGVSTADGVQMAAVGMKNMPEGRWHGQNLLLVLSEATHIDLSLWPNACPWKGSDIEGVAMGLR